MHTAPLLSSISAFVLIAIAFAMSAYLKNVVEKGEQLLDDIDEAKLTKFPAGAPQTIKKSHDLEMSPEDAEYRGSVSDLVQHFCNRSHDSCCRF